MRMRDYEVALLEVAKRYAIKRGYHRESDDFASYACLRALEKGVKINLQWAFTDYMRKQYGDPRSKSWHKTVYLDEPVGDTEDLTLGNLLVAPPDEEPLPLLCYRSEREVFITARLVEGFRQHEIAQMLGVSRSRISQLVVRLARRSTHFDLVVGLIPPQARRWVASIYALKQKKCGRKTKHELFNDHARSLARRKTQNHRRAVRSV